MNNKNNTTNNKTDNKNDNVKNNDNKNNTTNNKTDNKNDNVKNKNNLLTQDKQPLLPSDNVLKKNEKRDEFTSNEPQLPQSNMQYTPLFGGSNKILPFAFGPSNEQPPPPSSSFSSRFHFDGPAFFTLNVEPTHSSSFSFSRSNKPSSFSFNHSKEQPLPFSMSSSNKPIYSIFPCTNLPSLFPSIKYPNFPLEWFRQKNEMSFGSYLNTKKTETHTKIQNKSLLYILPIYHQRCLSSGTYLSLGKDISSSNYYFVNVLTNHIERICVDHNEIENYIDTTKNHVLDDHVPELLCKYCHGYTFYFIRYIYCKNLTEWEIESCYPFAGCRLTTKYNITMPIQERYDFDTLGFKQKMDLFKDGIYDNPNYIHDGDYILHYSFYIIGPSIKNHHRNNFASPLIDVKTYIIVLEEPDGTHKIYMCGGYLDYFRLLERQLNEQQFEIAMYCTYYDLLWGGFVIKAKYENTEGKFNFEVLKLSYTPFHNKKIENNVFV